MQGVAGNGKGAGFRDFHQPITIVAHGDWGIDYLSQHINDGALNLDPPYQRGHVWTLEQQQNFLGFVLEGGRPPEAFVRELAFDKPPFFEVVDGKQRMTALHKWWMGEISAKLPTSGQMVWAKDLDVVETRFAKREMNTSVQFLRGNDEEIMRVYLRLNRGGTVHTDDEIRKVERLIEASREEIKLTNSQKRVLQILHDGGKYTGGKLIRKDGTEERTSSAVGYKLMEMNLLNGNNKLTEKGEFQAERLANAWREGR